MGIDQLRSDIVGHVILPTLFRKLVDDRTQFFVNPTGRFVIGGPAGDSGLTGRKLIADTYGGYARHGDGAFSGKDATKMDRSGAYMARYIAKNVVFSGLADQCEVQLSYSIGLAEPVSLRVDTFGTEKIDRDALTRTVLRSVDCRPAAMIERFGLRRPIYSAVSCYGHFGANANMMPWKPRILPSGCNLVPACRRKSRKRFHPCQIHSQPSFLFSSLIRKREKLRLAKSPPPRSAAEGFLHAQKSFCLILTPEGFLFCCKPKGFLVHTCVKMSELAFCSDSDYNVFIICTWIKRRRACSD